MLNKAHKTAETKIQDTDVEWRILGALLEPKNIDWVNRISPAIFTDMREDIFRAIQMAFIDYGVITFEGINKHLEGNIPGELFAAQGAEIRSAVDEGVRLARKRQLYERSLLLKELSQDFAPDERKIREALDMPPVMAEEEGSIHTGVAIFLGNVHAKLAGDYRFISTGLPFLDNKLGGEWPPKTLIGILGGHGSGKTALVGNSMLRMAQDEDPKASLIFSLEMAREELVMRWIADLVSIDTKNIRSGNISSDELHRIEKAAIGIQKMPMYIIDNAKITLPQMVYEIRKYVHKHGVRVVFLDYLQLINHKPTKNDNNDLGEVAETLKAVAKREGITIVILSQITEGNNSTFRFRDSGEVGAVVDAALEIKLDDDTGSVKNMIIEWHKNRLGSLGITAVQFIGAYQRFVGAVVD